MKVAIGKSDAVLDFISIVVKEHPADWMGPLYVGVVLDFFFVGVLLSQVTSYYSTFPRDSAWVKRLVGVVTLLSIAKCVISFLVVWDKNILGFGHWRVAASVPWNIWLEVPASAVMSTVAQSFFVWRCFTLTGRNWYLLALLIAILLSVVGLSMAVAVRYAIDPFNLPPIHELGTPMLANSVVVDIVITLVVSYKLVRSRRGFSSTTDTMLHKLLAITWESAAPPALNQVINLAVFVTMTDKNAMHGLLNMITPRLYVFSLLHTLNSRATILAESSNGTSGFDHSHHGTLGQTTGVPRGRKSRNFLALSKLSKKRTTFNPNGTMPVHIQTETIVHTSSADDHGHGLARGRSVLRHVGVEVDVKALGAKTNSIAKSEDVESVVSSRWDKEKEAAEDIEAGSSHTRSNSGLGK